MQTVENAINAQVRCPRCGAVGRWARLGRTDVRANSRIDRLRCSECSACIVAKACRHVGMRNGHLRLRDEYETLVSLQSRFPQGEAYGTLAPLSYVTAADYEVMVTRLFAGCDLRRGLRVFDDTTLQAAFFAAGKWLRTLHATSDLALRCRPLGVDEKIADLLRVYGPVLRARRVLRNACEVFTRAGRSMSTTNAAAVLLHGDFKPQNVMYDGARCVGLDIHWRTESVALYDLAPFLNHMWLAARSLRSRRHTLAERHFLAGYGYTGENRALRWAQLYFALCQLGRYRLRGHVAAVYGHLRLSPLVRDLVERLGVAGGDTCVQWLDGMRGEGGQKRA